MKDHALDCSKTPWNFMKCHEVAVVKANMADEMRKRDSGGSFAPQYRLQAPGEQVRIAGLKKRPEFNGAIGEVISSRADDKGFLMVKLRWPIIADPSYQDLKKQPTLPAGCSFREILVQPRCDFAACSMWSFLLVLRLIFV
eukprot:TRINITY_DN29548_c0_g1_i1.p2 TRINITY_DN29548_c0_g1~~TRINITY_DN29548_c0_g1_i1.p2  ORF type:complete len:141 (+),score=30.79 TRINITY_DN29548_c0_g1_i1:125-547(+)